MKTTTCWVHRAVRVGGFNPVTNFTMDENEEKKADETTEEEVAAPAPTEPEEEEKEVI